MEVFNKLNSSSTSRPEILTSFMLISPPKFINPEIYRFKFLKCPICSGQPVHNHEQEQCYYILKGKGLMIIEDENPRK